MTLYQFNNLPEREQEIAQKEAVLLADREDESNTIYLFGLHGFYVEVYCHKEFSFLSWRRSFSSVELLSAYLERIDINL